jgi:hypothetical protein
MMEDPKVIQLTANYLIAPEIRDPSGYALYDTQRRAHAWMNEDKATFEDGDKYLVSLNKSARKILLKNVSKGEEKTIEY